MTVKTLAEVPPDVVANVEAVVRPIPRAAPRTSHVEISFDLAPGACAQFFVEAVPVTASTPAGEVEPIVIQAVAVGPVLAAALTNVPAAKPADGPEPAPVMPEPTPSPRPEPSQSDGTDSGAVSHVQICAELPEGMALRVTMQSVTEGNRREAAPLPITAAPAQPRAARPRVARPASTGAATLQQLRRSLTASRERAWRAIAQVREHQWALGLFVSGLVVYAVTRLWALDRFPIYFFADESANPLLAAALIARGFRDAAGNWFPLYFEAAANRWTPLLSVYVHAVSLLLFGKSLFVTRATSAVFSLFGAAAVGLILRNVFRLRFWWVGVLLLAITPAWFLHSRTAFETVIMVSFFACFLLCYMLYRVRSPRYLYPALILGAAAFYTYSNGQFVMAAMGVLLLLSDGRYHWQQRRVIARGLLLGALLLVPLLLFRFQHPSAFGDHLHAIDSYLTQQIPIGDKVRLIVQTYFYGLSPQYLFLPNDHDLPRHVMQGYGHLGLALAPLVALGLLISLRDWRSSPHRAVLLSALAAPVGAALVGVGITRVLSLVITSSLLAGLGLNAVLEWLTVRAARWRPVAASAPIMFALAAFVLLAWASLGMLRDALTNGPLWYRDYGLYGMQYGAEQLFGEAVPAELAADPNVTVMVTSTWANGADVFAQFFLSPAQQSRVVIRDIQYYTFAQHDLANSLLIMTPAEYQAAAGDKKFKLVQVERVLPYPDGTPGFYFARLTYADDVAVNFAAEEAERQKPVEETIQLDGQTVDVIHSRFDAGALPNVFDGDIFTLARGQEANPMVIEMHFPTPRLLSSMTLDTGAMDSFSVTIISTIAGQAPATVFYQTYKSLPAEPHLTLAFASGQQPVSVLRLEIKNLASGDTAQIHVREIALH